MTGLLHQGISIFGSEKIEKQQTKRRTTSEDCF